MLCMQVLEDLSFVILEAALCSFKPSRRPSYANPCSEALMSPELRDSSHLQVPEDPSFLILEAALSSFKPLQQSSWLLFCHHMMRSNNCNLHAGAGAPELCDPGGSAVQLQALAAALS